MGRKPACESATGGHAPGHPASLHEMLHAWGEQAAKLQSGEISKEDYDCWRYRYPEFDITNHLHKIILT